MFYFLSILSLTILIIAVNGIFLLPILNLNFLQMSLYVVASVICVILIDGIFAFIVRWLMPKKWFSVEKKVFSANKKECKFYEKIGIKKWKDKVIELGFFTNFRKNKIAKPNDKDYIERYIIEANYGVLVHIFDCLFGFLIILLFLPFWCSIGLPVAIVNFILNCLPIFVLRYNLPKLHNLYKLNLIKAQKNSF